MNAMRSLIIAGILWIACGGVASAADLFVTPVSPAPHSIMAIGEHYLMVVRTLPGALCTVDVTVPGQVKVTHGGAVKADSAGTASWRAYVTSNPGERHATATCSLSGTKVSADWTYTVQ